MFDTKEIVNKYDIESKIESKLHLKEVRSLAVDAQRLVFEGLRDKEEEKESPRYSLASSDRVSQPVSLI